MGVRSLTSSPELRIWGIPSRAARTNAALRQTVLDQSSCYMDLSFIGKDCIKHCKHVLVECIMKAKAGYHYIATVAHLAAVSSTVTNVNVSTTVKFTESVHAFLYYTDPESEQMKIAYLPCMVTTSEHG